MLTIVYYYTCLMSGMVELGAVLWGFAQGYTVLMVLGLGMAYQLGNLLRFVVPGAIARHQGILFLLLTAMSILLTTLPVSTASYVVAITVQVVFSTLLQNIRSAVQGDIPRWRKRTSRVVGFFLSAAMYFYGAQCMALFAVSLAVLSHFVPKFWYDRWVQRHWAGEVGIPRISWAMVTHQAHYFAYSYVMLMLVLMHYKNPLLATLWFIANWIPYTITEPLVQKLHLTSWLTIALSAHLFNALVLLGMYFFLNRNIVVTLVLWVLTGFGGGNVFCIREALAPVVRYDKDIWSFSEQVGHIIGMVGAITVTAVLGMNETLLLGVGFALITIPAILFVMHAHKAS